MACSICGKDLPFFSRLFGGVNHPECVQARDRKLRQEVEAKRRKEEEELAARQKEMLDQIAKGDFRPLNEQSEMMLDKNETLCMLIKGCWSTLFYPRAAGRIAPGQAIRVDGLKKVDFGSLHITDKRICFTGRGGAKVTPLKKLLQCEVRGDALHISAQGRTSSTYFIIESAPALELAQACIMKLAEMAKVKSYVWSSLADADTCPTCKKMDGDERKRKNLFPFQAPHPQCTSGKGCRCQIVPVYDDEGVVNLG